MMVRKHVFRGALTVIAVCALLATAAVLFASCGKEGGEGGVGNGKGAEVKIEDQGDIDALLEDLDGSMNAVSADDFSTEQLSDGELGL